MAEAVGETNAADGLMRAELTRHIEELELKIDGLLDMVGE